MSTTIQGWLVCDGDCIVIRDGMFKADIGYSSTPESPLPPPAECVRIEIEVSAQADDPNPRVAAIHAYECDDQFEQTARGASLTDRQNQLLQQYIDSEIPPYMLQAGGRAVVDAFLGPQKPPANPRPRKPQRPQDPNERPLSFSCRECGHQHAGATVGGMALRPIIGFACPDCGTIICRNCQETKVKENAERAGLADTVVEHLGRTYAYADWYAEECQFCAADHQMQPVHGTVAETRQDGRASPGSFFGLLLRVLFWLVLLAALLVTIYFWYTG